MKCAGGRKFDNMKRHVKQSLLLVSGVTLLPASYAQHSGPRRLMNQASSILANSLGKLLVLKWLRFSWFVLGEHCFRCYTYGYNINNPAGDVVLTGPPPDSLRRLTSFNLLSMPRFRRCLSASEPVGGFYQDNGPVDCFGSFPWWCHSWHDQCAYLVFIRFGTRHAMRVRAVPIHPVRGLQIPAANRFPVASRAVPEPRPSPCWPWLCYSRLPSFV